MNRFRDLLACPACAARLATNLACGGCGAVFEAPDGIPNLRLPGSARTDTVRQFYERAPFPGYSPRDSLHALRAKAERSLFARLLGFPAAKPNAGRTTDALLEGTIFRSYNAREF